jgi:hypothetical protein
MLEGYFAEPSWGQVRWPGKDWVIVRIRLGQFRRAPGPKMGQRLVPRDQGYPEGLQLRAYPKNNTRIDELVIYRGKDIEPPTRVRGVNWRRNGDELELSWQRATDNTLTAYYSVYAGKKLLVQTRGLQARIKATAAGTEPITVLAFDLDGNASEPSEAVTVTR